MEKQYFWSRILILLTVTLLPLFSLSAQTSKEITGTVTSTEEAEPLVGVNILIKGTSTGTVTDVDGNYKINATESDVLVFSFIGYIAQEVTVGDQSSISVQLKLDSENIDEVVVVGYGTMKKSHISGSISKIKNEGLEKIPVTRADQALQGKLAGVKIQQTDAQVGSAPTITIRGVSSINTSNSPLIVVDGYPIPDDLSSIDMSNVESIEVLKDAASAAIYGSRASNGVILVTTKKGSEGKSTFSINSYVGFKNVYPYDHIYSTVDEWIDFARTDAAARGLTVPGQIQAMEDLGTYTDWEDVALRKNAKIQNYNFTASGGNKKSRYYLGLGYASDEGIVETNNYEKYSFNTSLDTKLKDWFEIGATVNGMYNKQRVAAVGFHDIIRTQAWTPLYHTAATAAYAQAAGFDVQAGDYAHERHFSNVNGVNLVNSTGQNGWAYLEGQYERYETFSGSANTYAKLQITDKIDFKTSFGAYFKNKENSYYMASYAKNNGDTRGTNGNYKTINWLNENLLSYNNTFIEKHNVNAIAGFSTQSNSSATAYMDVSDFLTDDIHTLNAGTTINSAYTTKSKNTMVSAFFRLNYSYQNKYIASVSSRWDGSSRFGEENKWAYFPAFSLAWRVSEEEFIKSIDFISELKIRASYGSTGNNNIGDYTALAVVQPGSNATFGTVYQGFTQSSIANPTLSWEKTNETDFGLDLGIFDSRISIGVDYYNIETDQLLLDKEIPSVTGFTSTWTNLGIVRNKGWEFEITSHNVVKDNFKWITTANFYTNDNELVDMGGVDELISTPDSKRPSQFIARVGQPLVQFYGYEVDYTMGENGEVPRNMLSTPYYPIDVESADVYVKDQNGDGVINEDDRVVLGDPYYDFNWSITNEFTYKNFDLSFMFEGSHGAQVYNVDSYYYGTQWKGGHVAGVENEDFLQSKIVTNWNIQDASYITLRNLMVGYSLPSQLTERIGINRLRIYATASNLLYFMADNYTGLNPEGVNLFTDNITWGYQRGAIPVQRSFCFGIDIKF